MPTDNILTFPQNRFGPADRRELRRWESAASGIARYCFQVWDGRLIERTQDGDEYVGVTQDAPEKDGQFIVQPMRGRWELLDWRGEPIGTFRTLRGALEAICQTLPAAA